MAQSKLTLLALAGSALAGVVRREEPEIDHLIPEDLPFPTPSGWLTPTPHYFQEIGPSPIAFVQALSDRSREPHSTYLPSGLPSHFPQPTEEALPPLITSFPGAGEFAHTKDSPKPTSAIPAISHPAPPGVSYGGPPPIFSEPVRPEEPQLNTPPPVFQASSAHLLIPSSHAETLYASPTQPPSFTDGQPRPSDPAFVKPTEPWDALDTVKPTSYHEIPSWISHLPPPFETTGPEGSEKDHETAPSALPEAYQGPPHLPLDSIKSEVSETHSSSPAGPDHTPSPGESEQEPHPPPHGSYQEPPPLDFGSGDPSGESGPPAEPHHITLPAESYQAPPPTLAVPDESYQPKGNPPAGSHQLPPPPAEPYHKSSPVPLDSTPLEPHDPKSSAPESYQLLPPSSPQPSHPGYADHPAAPAIPHKGPSPHYGIVSPISCTYSGPDKALMDTNPPHPMGHKEEYPHPGETNPPPFAPPSEHGQEPHEIAPSHAVPTEKPGITLTDAYVPHLSKPETTVTEAPSVPHAAVPPIMPPNYTEVHSKPAIPSPTSDKPQPQGTTGEHHIYGSPSNTHATEASAVAERPSATKTALEPSKTGVPKAEESAVHYSSSTPASTVPITALLGAFGTLAFFFLR
ncbi:hypothetical protein DPV78_004800 [Talaromyces pinophilus]|nr:hypothetical protein DPV78_004800 [Talaromyces pinophilus]